jgi:predicted dehydrogenase
MELAPVQRALLLGTGGQLDLPLAWNPPGDRPSELAVETGATLEQPAPERLVFEPVDQYTRLVELFARAAEAGLPGPIPIEDSVKNMATLDALARSTRSGRWEPVVG